MKTSLKHPKLIISFFNGFINPHNRHIAFFFDFPLSIITIRKETMMLDAGVCPYKLALITFLPFVQPIELVRV